MKQCPGSSPLTRGKPRIRHWDGTDQGLIPAHAGKTRWTGDGRTSRAAHPRSRGENARDRDAGASALGSSPLTRGKPKPARLATATTGLIPAHAGKTWRQLTDAIPGAAHPRSRGENLESRPAKFNVDGSSPLMRGKLDKAAGNRGLEGLIPAHAGKTER